MEAEVQEILQIWKTKAKELMAFKEQNCIAAAANAKELVSFLQSSEPILRTWMNNYLAKNRETIFVKSYSSLILQWNKDLNLKFYIDKPQYIYVKEQWDRIFGSKPAYCFNLMEKVVLAAANRLCTYSADFIAHQNLCDDLTILAIHEGQVCSGDNWDGCYTCNTQYDMWKDELCRRLYESQHPLLNPNARCSWRIRECFRENPLSDDWLPIHHWCRNNRYCSNSHPLCYDFNEFCDKMKIQLSTSYSSKGYTPSSACSSFLSDLCNWALMDPRDYKKDFTKEYEVFDFLWNSLDIIRESYDLVLERAQEITDMF